MNIHPSAIVDAKAQIGEGVEIGPYCIVGPDVVLHSGVRLLHHVVIEGHTEIGADCVISSFASLGGPPQHLAHRLGLVGHWLPCRVGLGRDLFLRSG